MIVRIDPAKPDPDLIEAAAKTIGRGGLVIIPTSGLYGMAVDALNPTAVDRLVHLKGRDADKPILALIGDRSQLDRLITDPSQLAASLMDRFWPGALTLVMPAAKGLPAPLVSVDGKIGVRLVAHPVAVALATAVKGPITGTSANYAGTPASARIDEIDQQLLARADMVLDAGLLKGGPGSTVVDVTAGKPVVLREGAVAAQQIMRFQ